MISATARLRKRFPWILYWIVLAAIILFALAPIGSVVLCGAIANAYGCKVDEGSVHPCIINGHDYGELLYSLGVMGRSLRQEAELLSREPESRTLRIGEPPRTG